MFCFLILKGITCFLVVAHLHVNKTLYCKDYNSEPVIHQTKNTAREIQQWNQEKTKFKQMQTTFAKKNLDDTY